MSKKLQPTFDQRARCDARPTASLPPLQSALKAVSRWNMLCLGGNSLARASPVATPKKCLLAGELLGASLGKVWTPARLGWHDPTYSESPTVDRRHAATNCGIRVV